MHLVCSVCACQVVTRLSFEGCKRLICFLLLYQRYEIKLLIGVTAKKKYIEQRWRIRGDFRCIFLIILRRFIHRHLVVFKFYGENRII